MIKKTAGLATVLVSVLALTGCGATGAQAPTRNIKQVTDGVEGQSGSIYIRDLLLVAQPDGNAALVGTFINEETTSNSLTGIKVAGIDATLSSVSGSFDLPQNTPLIFAGDSADATGYVAGLNAKPGDRVEVVVSFSNSPSVTLSTLVRAKSDYFTGVGGKPAQTPTPASSK